MNIKQMTNKQLGYLAFAVIILILVIFAIIRVIRVRGDGSSTEESGSSGIYNTLRSGYRYDPEIYYKSGGSVGYSTYPYDTNPDMGYVNYSYYNPLYYTRYFPQSLSWPWMRNHNRYAFIRRGHRGHRGHRRHRGHRDRKHND